MMAHFLALLIESYADCGGMLTMVLLSDDPRYSGRRFYFFPPAVSTYMKAENTMMCDRFEKSDVHNTKLALQFCTNPDVSSYSDASITVIVVKQRKSLREIRVFLGEMSTAHRKLNDPKSTFFCRFFFP